MRAQIENRRLRSCLWIVALLQKHLRLTFAEINQYWQQDEDISGGLSLPRRTFTDYQHVIQDTLGVIIECDKRTNTYNIALQDDGGLSEWLISSFSVGQLVQESQAVRDRILLGNAPQGMQYFNLIVESIRRGCCLEAGYKKFEDAEPYHCHLRPYCLKYYGERWYLLAIKDDGAHPITLALDRMTEMRLLSEDLWQPEETFSPAQHYANSFGIWGAEGEPPVIRLRVYGRERNYLRTQPLHHSQKERVIDDETSDFTLRCHPTRDLLLHLLSHGRGIEVIEPRQLREEMVEELRGMADHYGLISHK